MGHHYNPQAHLKRFAADDKQEKIWTYDKATKTSKLLPIKKVAQETNYYPEHVEADLNIRFEIPGNRSTRKLIQGEKLSPEERFQMAGFMFTMYSRSPLARQKGWETANRVIPKTFRETRERFRFLADNAENEEGGLMALGVIAELYEIERRWEAKLPAEAVDEINTPSKSLVCINAIYEMCWEILPVTEGMIFITSDCPAHFFGGIGLGSRDAEFTFTLSDSWALVAHPRGEIFGMRFRYQTRTQITKEINRRIISNATRFTYSSRNEGWIKLTADKSPYLSLIRW